MRFIAIMFFSDHSDFSGRLLLLMPDVRSKPSGIMLFSTALLYHTSTYISSSSIPLLILPAFWCFLSSIIYCTKKAVFNGLFATPAMRCLTLLESLIWASQMMTVGSKPYFECTCAVAFMPVFPTRQRLLQVIKLKTCRSFSEINYHDFSKFSTRFEFYFCA